MIDIKKARRELGLSQSELGRLLDTDAQSVRRMEMPSDATTSRPPAPRVTRLINAYLDGHRPDDWNETGGHKMDEQNKLASRLFKSPDYFIKYSAGRPIACHPYYAGSSFYEMGKEENCNTKTEATQYLKDKCAEHAKLILENDA